MTYIDVLIKGDNKGEMPWETMEFERAAPWVRRMFGSPNVLIDYFRHFSYPREKLSIKLLIWHKKLALRGDVLKEVGRQIKLFFFGDSICFGQGVSPHETWVSRISAEISKRRGSDAVLVQNPSINGNTTRMALERMPHDVQSHAPDIVFVQYGLNDCNAWMSDGGNRRVSETAFVANLHEIVARAKSFGAKEVLLGTNHPTTRTHSILEGTDICFEDSNQRYNDLIRQVAHDLKVPLSDIGREIADMAHQGKLTIADTLLKDELHLSVCGHDVYFEARLPVIEAAIGRVADLL